MYSLHENNVCRKQSPFEELFNNVQFGTLQIYILLICTNLIVRCMLYGVSPGTCVWLFGYMFEALLRLHK